jgi:hypothetical protein
VSKVAFSGDRNWISDEAVREVILSLPEDTLFILGDARGLDTEAKEICEELGREFIVEEADWERYGKGAGPERNGRMLDHLEEGDWLYAFHDSPSTAKGTKNCVKQAKERGINVWRVTSAGNLKPWR